MFSIFNNKNQILCDHAKLPFRLFRFISSHDCVPHFTTSKHLFSKRLKGNSSSSSFQSEQTMKLLPLTMLSLVGAWTSQKSIQLTSSGICETCEKYSDGCNLCYCYNTTWTDHCVQYHCWKNQGYPDLGCINCRPGYRLNSTTKQCESTMCTTHRIDNCKTFSVQKFNLDIFLYFCILLKIHHVPA